MPPPIPPLLRNNSEFSPQPASDRIRQFLLKLPDSIPSPSTSQPPTVCQHRETHSDCLGTKTSRNQSRSFDPAILSQTEWNHRSHKQTLVEYLKLKGRRVKGMIFESEDECYDKRTLQSDRIFANTFACFGSPSPTLYSLYLSFAFF